VVRGQGESDWHVLKSVLGRLVPVLLLSACSVVAGTCTAAADAPVRCAHGNSYNPRTGKCVLTVSPNPHEAMDSSTTSEPVNSKGTKRCVSSYPGKEVPCRDGSSWWSNARDCYVSLSDPQPAKSDLQWEGHKTGAIYECYSPALVGSRRYTFWSATSPAGLADRLSPGRPAASMGEPGSRLVAGQAGLRAELSGRSNAALTADAQPAAAALMRPDAAESRPAQGMIGDCKSHVEFSFPLLVQPFPAPVSWWPWPTGNSSLPRPVARSSSGP
jgi:hypothetical protein